MSSSCKCSALLQMPWLRFLSIGLIGINFGGKRRLCSKLLLRCMSCEKAGQLFALNSGHEQDVKVQAGRV